MHHLQVPQLEILVAGDAGSGKENFVNGFLKYFPPSAEVRRKSGTVYSLYHPDRNIKIQLYDVHNVESMDPSAYDKMDVVFFYYVAHDPESLRNLEKWILLLEQKMEPSPRTKKVQSILLADWTSVGSQRDMANFLAAKVNEMKDSYGIKLFIQSSFEDEESASNAFEIIMREVSPPKVKKEHFKRRVSPSTLVRKELDQYSDHLSRLSSCNSGDRHAEEVRNLESSFEGLVV